MGVHIICLYAYMHIYIYIYKTNHSLRADSASPQKSHLKREGRPGGNLDLWYIRTLTRFCQSHLIGRPVALVARASGVRSVCLYDICTYHHLHANSNAIAPMSFLSPSSNSGESRNINKMARCWAKARTWMLHSGIQIA